MSEKIEFIPAKDLPVAEGDEVDVLCVENGELKRKEGASLGGGGGSASDLPIEIVTFTWDGSNYTCDHDYYQIYEKSAEGKILLGRLLYSQFGEFLGRVYLLTGSTQPSDYSIWLFKAADGDYTMNVSEDGSVWGS